MLTVAEARQKIAEAMPEYGIESVPLEETAGRILRQPVSAERDQPPFDRVTMDGIAVSYTALAGGRREFAIQGRQYAGDTQQSLADESRCIEIMTGAVLPTAADTVIPVERVSVANQVATLEADYRPDQGQFIHRQGSDYEDGQIVLQPGVPIAPVDIAVLASCGLDTVNVSRLPRVRVVSTGNELVPAGQPIRSHEVRLSNGPALVTMLKSHGFTESGHDHLADDKAELRARLAELLDKNDVLVLSGGVSMGKADFVPEVLRQLGVTLVFHRISQRPGKPMWFGIAEDGQAVFALPGNPVSALVCCRQYVLPALLNASGRSSSPDESIALAEDVEFRPNLTCFLPIRLGTGDGGETVAIPVPTNTSGDFAALSGTDGYVELRQEAAFFSGGFDRAAASLASELIVMLLVGR